MMHLKGICQLTWSTCITEHSPSWKSQGPGPQRKERAIFCIKPPPAFPTHPSPVPQRPATPMSMAGPTPPQPRQAPLSPGRTPQIPPTRDGLDPQPMSPVSPGSPPAAQWTKKWLGQTWRGGRHPTCAPSHQPWHAQCAPPRWREPSHQRRAKVF